MRIIRMLLLSGSALCAAASLALADDVPALDTGLAALNVGELAIAAAPVLSKTTLPQTPGLPLSARDKAAFGNRATTLGILPSADAPAGPSVSWSGYARTGVIYHGAN